MLMTYAHMKINRSLSICNAALFWS